MGGGLGGRETGWEPPPVDGLLRFANSFIVFRAGSHGKKTGCIGNLVRTFFICFAFFGVFRGSGGRHIKFAMQKFLFFEWEIADFHFLAS